MTRWIEKEYSKNHKLEKGQLQMLRFMGWCHVYL